MELRYPWILIILIVTLIALIFVKSRKMEEYKNGKKVANTKYIKNDNYYKSIVKKYNIISKCIKIACILAIIISFVLLARPSKEDTFGNPKYNRDIILCMDVSASVSEVNKELVDKLKDTVKNLKGERLGISIFNTSSVLVVPLTDDYDYILDTLDKLKEALEVYGKGSNLNFFENKNLLELTSYIQSGTLIGNEERGSSLIGDGLASTVYDFTDLDKDTTRSRIVIFSTDNDLAGTPIVSLTDAAKLCKKKNITVFGIGTKNMKNEQEFKSAIEITGGTYYQEGNSKNMDDIVKNIEKKSKSLIEDEKKTRIIDKPGVCMWLLTIIVVVLFSFTKVIKA